MIRRHGYHGLDEGELSNRVWREARSTVEALINSYRSVSDPGAAEASRREQRLDAQSELLRALPPGRRPGMRVLLRLASRYVPLRETGKASFLQTLDVARFALRHLGADLEASGLLESDDDVFYLTCDEAIAPIPPADARDLVAFRRERRLRYARQPLPNVWQGAPPVVAEPELDSRSRGSIVVSGIGVQPGTVTGMARVLDGPASFAELVPGEVLVCRATDPGWTSLFPLASGVVIDVGGTMSHGAIVAREFGVPCVVNTKDGTRRLETGDTVRVDGSSGRVEVLDRVSREGSR
jgi:pyruvate,water dikinase